MLGPMPYAVQQRMTDAAFPAGSYYYTKGGFLADLTDEAIDVFAHTRLQSRRPCRGPHSDCLWCRRPSCFRRDGLSASPIPVRARHRLTVARPAHTEKNVGWARDFWKALQPFAGGCAYVNDLGQDDEDRIRIAYGANYERLTA